MAPQAKKRKDPPQSTNLHHFFSQDANQPKKSKTQPSSKVKGKRRGVLGPSQDVIVIDSDSDRDIPTTKGKGKGIRREVSTEIEFIDGPVVHGTTKKHKGTSGSGKVLSNKGATLSSDKITFTPNEDGMLSFGKSSDLLKSSGPSRTVKTEGGAFQSAPRADSPGMNEDDSSFLSFGSPTSLLRDPGLLKLPQDVVQVETSFSNPLKVEEIGEASRPYINPIQETSSSIFENSSVPPSAVNLDDDDWAMGDDEMALVDPKPEDEDNDTDVEDIEIDSSIRASTSAHENHDEIAKCPICSLHLVGLLVTVRSFISFLHDRD